MVLIRTKAFSGSLSHRHPQAKYPPNFQTLRRNGGVLHKTTLFVPTAEAQKATVLVRKRFFLFLFFVITVGSVYQARSQVPAMANFMSKFVYGQQS